MKNKEDKRFEAATKILASLVPEREATGNKSRERIVEISVHYADLLIDKLEEKEIKEGRINPDNNIEWDTELEEYIRY